MARVKNKERRHEIMASYKGWCMQGDCLHLWQTITGMKSFKELGIKANDISKDGKRYFDVPPVALMDILNQPVEVVDFVTGVETKNGCGRYAVLVNFNGDERKFITNNFKMKDILDQCLDSNVFPFTTTIRRRAAAGSKADYYFD